MSIGKLLFATVIVAVAATEAHPDLERDLDEVARAGTVMVDGDICERIVTKRAAEYFFKQDPADKWVASDNYDVNDAEFIATKKTLMRLARLAPFPCDVNLWMPIASHPGKVHIVVRNVNELSQFWEWGRLHQDIPPEMKSVLETGRRIAVQDKPGFVSVLSPVYNSMGDRVGILEAVARIHPDVHENVK